MHSSASTLKTTDLYVHFKGVNCLVCESYLNRAVFLNVNYLNISNFSNQEIFIAQQAHTKFYFELQNKYETQTLTSDCLQFKRKGTHVVYNNALLLSAGM